jgi:glycosyltransferase involved in cell wall biosynthesis
MFTESMACGTPVITYARGSAPEIIIDGVTGFLVNQSEELKRGNWIIKKTGIDGLCEAIERIYTMPENQYRQIRKACRTHVEQNFTVEKMIDGYEKVYEKILNSKS